MQYSVCCGTGNGKTPGQNHRAPHPSGLCPVYEGTVRPLSRCKKIRLVQDNLSTHSGGSFYETSDAETARSPVSRFEFHFTPKKAGWLNMAEIELSALSKNCPDQRIGSVEKLQEIISVRVQERNDACAKISWQFSTTDARIKFKRFCKN